jgi:hypothetical protein
LEIGGSGFPVLLSLQKFDTSLGRLEAIDITLTSTALLQAEVLNFNPGTATFADADACGSVTVTGLDGVQSVVPLSTVPFSGSISGGSFSSWSSVLGPETTLSVSAASHVAATDFGAYDESGSGGSLNFPLDASFSGSYSGEDSSGLFFTGQAGDYGSIQIEYTYDAAPDSWSLFPELCLLCVCGMAGFGREAKRSVKTGETKLPLPCG